LTAGAVAYIAGANDLVINAVAWPVFLAVAAYFWSRDP
jgi:hypothetical protein